MSMSFYWNRPKEELVEEIFEPIITAVGKAVPLGSLDEPNKLVCGLVLLRVISQPVSNACCMGMFDG